MASDEREAILVADLAYGDCGKGTIVDYLVRSRGAGAVVRFNGGPQAGHNVVTPDGRHHTFSHFGSGTFVPGVRTVLSRFMFIEPYSLLNEAEHLQQISVAGAMDRLWIDARCPVITPCHEAANRITELTRGDAAHGTCGRGVGDAARDQIEQPDLMLTAGELDDRAVVRRKLQQLCDAKARSLEGVIRSNSNSDRARSLVAVFLEGSWIETAVEVYATVARHVHLIDDAITACGDERVVVFEGAQGVLLDEWFGFHPHTTWSTTTFANADALLDDMGFAGARKHVGVLRTYFTRHGVGPFVTENAAMRALLPEAHNVDQGWQGAFRVGAFDAVAARYAVNVVGGVDAIALTHVDRALASPLPMCVAYHVDGTPTTHIEVRRPADLVWQEQLTGWLQRCRPECRPMPNVDVVDVVHAIEGELGVVVGIASTGPTANEKQSFGQV
jgi:adenylosuccinate synthase